jgi:hypothetical protein
MSSHKPISVHTTRTMMFNEFSRIMENGLSIGNFEKALEDNAANKLTKNNQVKTNKLLQQLYGFKQSDYQFVALEYFWKLADTNTKPILAFLFAVNKDFLLLQSIDIVKLSRLKDSVPISKFEENIEEYHPGRYSPITRFSAAKNLASSWKQAGFIQGKIRNIRVQPEIHYTVVAYALLLAHLNGYQGDFIFTHPSVRALCLSELNIRDLAVEAAKRDMLSYQHSGGVTVFNFNNLINKLNINAFNS